MMTCAHPLCSSIVRKGIVGLTGALMIVFVLGHMTGNLLIFLPPEAINSYAEFLHEAAADCLCRPSAVGKQLGISPHVAYRLGGDAICYLSLAALYRRCDRPQC